jgi:hypothetical protein
MTKIIIDLDDPELHKAAEEIADRIRDQFPDAQLVIEESIEPPKLFVIATVDLYDTDPVMDAYMDSLLDAQIARLPLEVIVLRTPEREQEVRDELRRLRSSGQRNLRPAG